MEPWSFAVTLYSAVSELTQEEEALFTPVAFILVAVATVGITCFAFRFFPVGLLRTGFITLVFEPGGRRWSFFHELC